MEGTYRLSEEDNPSPEDVEAVRWGLSRFNQQIAGDDGFAMSAVKPSGVLLQRDVERGKPNQQADAENENG